MEIKFKKPPDKTGQEHNKQIYSHDKLHSLFQGTYRKVSYHCKHMCTTIYWILLRDIYIQKSFFFFCRINK